MAWGMEVNILGSDRYEELKLAGWEPFHFALVPMPPDPQKLTTGRPSLPDMAVFVGQRIPDAEIVVGIN